MTSAYACSCFRSLSIFLADLLIIFPSDVLSVVAEKNANVTDKCFFRQKKFQYI